MSVESEENLGNASKDNNGAQELERKKVEEEKKKRKRETEGKNRKEEEAKKDSVTQESEDIISKKTAEKIKIDGDEVKDYLRGELEGASTPKQRLEAERALQNIAEGLSKLEGQTPPELILPKREEVYKVLRENGIEANHDEDDRRYNAHLDYWFDGHVRRLESVELLFEEQAPIYNALMLVVNRLEFTTETKDLGARLRVKLETRRLRKLMSRAWEVGSTPEVILDVAGKMNMGTFKELFTTRTPDRLNMETGEVIDGGKQIALEAFRQYEKMGQELLSLRKQEDDAKGGAKKKLKKQAENKEAEIVNFFRHGGVETYKKGGDEKTAFIDRALKDLEGSDNEEEKERLSELLWARKFGGSLWSMTQRAARYNVQLVESGGDFYSARVQNFSSHIVKDKTHEDTKEIWDPKKGKFKGEAFDLDFRGFFTEVFAGVKLNGKVKLNAEGEVDKEHGKELSGRKWLEDKRIIFDKKIDLGETKKGDKEVLAKVDSLEHAELGSDELWDVLEQGFGVGEGMYGFRIFKTKQADDTLKMLLSPDSFLQSPSIEKFDELKVAFGHLGGGSTVIELGRERVTVPKRYAKTQELMERVFEWSRVDKKTSRKMSDHWKYAREAYIFNWIDSASKRNTIKKKQKDYMFRKYILRNRFALNPEVKARKIANKSIERGLFKDPVVRAMIFQGFLSELGKGMLEYVFSE